MATPAETLSFIADAANPQLGKLADSLGATRARIRVLKAHEAEIAKALRDSGAEVAIGSRWRVQVKRRRQESLDTRGLRDALPRDLWGEFLRVAEQVRLEVTPLG